MKDKSQKDWAVERLLSQGYVSRNSALQVFITRLGAIICDLNKEGWEITGHWYKTEKGKDFRYYLIRSPFKKQEYKLPNGEIISKTVRA